MSPTAVKTGCQWKSTMSEQACMIPPLISFRATYWLRTKNFFETGVFSMHLLHGVDGFSSCKLVQSPLDPLAAFSLCHIPREAEFSWISLLVSRKSQEEIYTRSTSELQYRTNNCSCKWDKPGKNVWYHVVAVEKTLLVNLWLIPERDLNFFVL